MSAAARKPVDLHRLARVLNLMASPYDGERLAAARIAVEIIRVGGTTWNELLDPSVVKLAQPPPAPPLDPGRIIAAALMRPARLTAWKFHFISGLAERRPRHLSDRQLAALAQIADKLGLRR